MSGAQIFDLLRAAWRQPMGLFWAGVAWLLDALRGLGPVQAGLVALLVVGSWTGLVWYFQKRLRERLERTPEGAGAREVGVEDPEGAADRARGAPPEGEEELAGGASPAPGPGPGTGVAPSRLTRGEIVRMELGHSFLVLPFKPFQLVGRGVKAVGRWFRGIFRRRKQGAERPGEAIGAGSSPLVATLGPSFLLGGLVTAGLYLAARLLEPLLSARLGLAKGLSLWQYLVFGYRPELSWYLPLERFPYLAGLLAVLFWLGVWSLAATGVRAFHWRHLGQDLAWRGEGGRDRPARDDPSVLPFWRRWAGASELWRPDPSYRRWARWLVGVGALLLAWAWLSLGADPYRIGPSELAVALVLWMSWAVHLLLEGRAPGEEKRPEREDRETERPHGWEDVLSHLTRHDHVKEPAPFRRWHLVPPEAAPARDESGAISPLVARLLSENGHREPGGETRPELRPMQGEVLETLALQGYVHTDPPSSPGSLTLGREAPEAVEDRSGLRSRNLVVLAPEGAGKSTLALLAVANHSLVHTRGSLVVVVDDGRAETLARAYRRALDVTPLRWSVRVRSPGDDLMTDLSRGIVPDVVVTGLRDLVVTLLDRSDSFETFLGNLGLLVIDDVEAFTGPREVHGQLAFRRLVHRVEDLLGVEELGGRDLAAPQVLILGTDGMHETSEWAQSLCGIDAVTRRYPESPSNGAGPPSAGGLDHRLHRLRDFRTDSGELLSLEALIQACETLEVPWHYRPCGDGRRDMGRGPLLLAEEPRHNQDDAEEACVVLLEGSWSEVEREVERLRRAGTAFARRRASGDPGRAEPEPIGLVTLADPDVEMAFTQLDREFALTPSLATLPRPVLRPPTGRVVEPHLAADLTQHWTEVAEVTRIFGDATAERLRALAEQSLLQAEERTDVEPKVNEYVRRVYVRALARAVRGAEEQDGDRTPRHALLPPRVSQVELVAPEAAVAVRDRATLLTLARIDAAAALLVYYPGRIFRDARGTFVVVGRASEEVERRSVAGGDEGGVVRKGDILVEPILTDSVSSPRRRLAVEALDEKGRDELRQSAGGAFLPPGRVLLGREPIELALEPTAVQVEHVATYRLGPVYSEVRQRSIASEGRTETAQKALETVALRIVPNPKPEEEARGRKGKATRSKKAQPHRLGRDEARLLAAAMRAVLPSMYRGGGESVGVALLVKESGARGKARGKGKKSRTEKAKPLEIDIYLFDSEAGGNGTARAIYRDGVDLLLRLCRLLVERVLSLDRLLALYDEWGDREEILAEARAEAGGGRRAEDVAEERREAHQALRQSLLDWLDSRLPPEGGAESQRDLARYFKSGAEKGDGDIIDLGRCWYSADGAVTDLLWAKHRWQHPDLGEVMLDVGFDRRTYLESKRLRESWSRLRGDARRGGDAYRSYIQKGDRSGDGRDGHDVREVKYRSFPDELGRSEKVTYEDSAAKDLHSLLFTLACACQKALAPLIAQFREEAHSATEGPVEPALLSHLTRFVQGIPNSPVGREVEAAMPGDPLERLLPHLRSPVEALLARRGEEIAKSFLLSVLLERAGFASGLFLSVKESGGRAFAGVSESRVPALDRTEPVLYAEVPKSGSSDDGGQRFLPIDVTGYRRVGEVHAAEPETWAFLPLFDLPQPADPTAGTSTGLAGEDAAPPTSEPGEPSPAAPAPGLDGPVEEPPNE